MNVSEGKCNTVDICLETNFTTKAAAPYCKTLSTTPKSEEICPRERVFFCVFGAQQNTKSDGLLVHFFATFTTLS